jgi:hypothetical protein
MKVGSYTKLSGLTRSTLNERASAVIFIQKNRNKFP